MSDLEKIVRPSQLKGVAIAEKVLEVRQPVVPIKVLLGDTGSGKQLQFSYSVSGKFYKDTHVKETTRRN